MNPKARTFVLRLGLTALGVLAATRIVRGIYYDSWQGLLIATLVLGFLNAFLRPVLLLLSLPVVVLTLGLFLWVINALLLSLVSWLVKPFHVASFWSALGGAAVISLVSGFGAIALGLNRRSTPKPPVPPARPESGPIIDI